MLKIKKILGLIIIVTMCIMTMTSTICANTKTEMASDNKEPSSFKVRNIIFAIDNCNVKVEKSTNSKFGFNYDNDVFIVTSRVNKDTIDISAKRKTDCSTDLLNMIIIYIPDVAYNNVTVKGYNSGIGLPELNANMKLTIDDCTMSSYVSKGFSKNITIKATNSSGTITFSKQSKDYTLNVIKSDSAVSIDDNFPAIHGKEYKYVNGNGASKINLNLKDCAFSIGIE